VKPCDCEGECSGFCGAHVEVSPKIWKSTSYWVAQCAHVEFAATLTAAARTKIHEHLTEGNADDAIYCDTDSVFSINERLVGVGSDLGMLENKGPFKGYIVAPKVYRKENADGTIEVKAKGVSNPSSKWDDIVGEETVFSDRVRGFATGARKGEFFNRDAVSRTVHEGCGDRIPDGNLTRAQNINAFREVR
jgi:hypothetical protein